MSEINVKQFKLALSTIKDRRRKYSHVSPQANLPKRSRSLKTHRALGQAVDAFLAKEGFQIDKFGKMLAQDHKRLRRVKRAEAAKYSTAQIKDLRRSLEDRRKALELVASLPTSQFVCLDKPFLIWQSPHPEYSILKDWNIEPWNSWAKILVDTNAGSDYTDFNFYFIWENQSEQDTVVNVSTSLVLRGVCEAELGPDEVPFGTGDWVDIGVFPSLSLLECWNEPYTEPAFQQSQSQTGAFLGVQAGGLWDSFEGQAAFDVANFNTFYDLSYKLFRIPAQATAIFEVSLLIFYGFWTDAKSLL